MFYKLRRKKEKCLKFVCVSGYERDLQVTESQITTNWETYMSFNDFFDGKIEVNLAGIKRNYLKLQSISSAAKVAATVKANGYGLGMIPVSKALYEEGCRNFFVASLGEAITLRKSLPHDTNIIILHGVKPDELEAFSFFDLIPVINNLTQLIIWNDYAKLKSHKLPTILHFDTGINRLGIDISEVREAVKILDQNQIEILYVMSHLACSNEIANPRNQNQLNSFKKIIEFFPQTKYSLANSGGIFLGKEYHFDLVRPGAAIFGIAPNTNIPNPMENILLMTSKVIHIKKLKHDGMAGYGDVAKVRAGMRIATISMGYADGYFRSLTNRCFVYLKGRIVPIIGKVSMDNVIIDISSFAEDEITFGTEVEIIGEHIKLADLAIWADTIPYEILTALSHRFKRDYLDEK